MVRPEPLTPGGGDSYRLEKNGAFLVWVILSLGCVVSMFSPPAALAVLPFALLFVKLNPYRFLVVWIGATLFFFETYRSMVVFIAVSDGLVFIYATLLALFALPAGLRFRVPMNLPFLCLYLLLVLTVALMPGALATYFAGFVLFDVKIMFLMGFIAVVVALEGPTRQPKKVFLLLGAVIVFSTLHALEMIASFLVHGGLRPTTWTAIYISNSIVLCAILLRLPLAARTRRALWVALVICTLGVVVIQTRSIWLSTVFCLGCLFVSNLLAMRGRILATLGRLALLVGGAVIALNVGFLLLARQTLFAFVTKRFADLEWIGLLDPYSSTGYRVHEGWAVWDERSVWGYGPGATINLFFTQLNKSEFIDWWSIHMGYLELLHKSGFVGLFLWTLMGLSLVALGWNLTRRGKKWDAAAGQAVILMLLNHSIASLSSNEFNRANSSVMWLLAFYITYTLGAAPAARRFKLRRARGDARAGISLPTGAPERPAPPA